MDNLGIKEERALLKIYSGLKNLETNLDQLEATCKEQLSMASNFDVDHTDTYLELMQPISNSLMMLKISMANSRYDLKYYRKLIPDYTESRVQITSKSNTDSGSTKSKKLKSRVDYLEDRVDRLEKIAFTAIAIAIAVILGYISDLI